MVCFRYYQIYFHIYFFLFDNQRDKIFNNYLFGITKNSSTFVVWKINLKTKIKYDTRPNV